MGVIEKFLALGSIAIGSAALNYDKAKIPLAIPFLDGYFELFNNAAL
ncbi:hypothetical protein J4479_05575 [Candidatus Woesearchaeota archaeon]|nr:hypothetical protein [Candidatus Woesearchaeota archaeon]